MKPLTKKWLDSHNQPGRLLYAEVSDIVAELRDLRTQVKAMKAERAEVESAWAALMKARFADNEEESCVPTALIRKLDDLISGKKT